jgi:hypothetical protein
LVDVHNTNPYGPYHKYLIEVIIVSSIFLIVDISAILFGLKSELGKHTPDLNKNEDVLYRYFTILKTRVD